jgi:hypothetical protein
MLRFAGVIQYLKFLCSKMFLYLNLQAKREIVRKIVGQI